GDRPWAGGGSRGWPGAGDGHAGAGRGGGGKSYGAVPAAGAGAWARSSAVPGGAGGRRPVTEGARHLRSGAGLRAVIYDLDGLLLGPEPAWMQAEAEILGGLGVPLTPERCLETTGLRIDEAVAHWAERYPWSGPTRSEVVERILDRVLHIIA